MKTFNLKLISASLITTLFLTGCMPDSLTKFKKDPPKKKVDLSTTPVVTDDGETINPSTLTDPTIFKFKYSNETLPFTEKSFVLAQPVSITPIFDGSISIEDLRPSVLIKCEVVSATALPPGLNLDADTCVISGNTLQTFSDTAVGNYGKPVSYTIRLSYLSKAGITKTLDSTFKLGVYRPLSNFAYTQNDKLLLRLTESGGRVKDVVANTVDDDPYVRGGLISTSEGTVGVVKYVDSETSRIGVSKVIPVEVDNITAISYFDTSKTPPTEQYPSLTTARFISNSSGAIGKVVKLYRPSSSSTRGVIYVETISKNIFFQDLQFIDDVKTYVGNATRITAKDETAGTIGVDDQYIIRKIGAPIPLDNDYQFFQEKFIVTNANINRIFEPGQTIETGLKIKPLDLAQLEPENNVTFTVSPSLPSGLTLDPATGEITGAFTSTLDPASFTITATNTLGSATAIIGLSSIYAPKDLSYSNRQLISLNSVTKFLEGETLFQPITPPLSTNIKARILRKYATPKWLSIETLNGPFAAGASLDSGNAFYSEKSFIPSTAITPTSTTPAATPIVVSYSIALTLADATGFDVEGYVSNAAGALGRIVAKDTNTIFIQYLTPGTPAVATPFLENQNVRNTEVYASGVTNTTIDEIDANNLKITLSAADVGTPVFAQGKDITTTNAIAGDLSAYIYDIDTSGASPIIWVSDIAKKPGTTPFFNIGQVVHDDEVATGNTKTITAVSTVNSFFVENGVALEIRPALLRGNSAVFSISPALPAGLKLDSRTGVISGTPTIRVAKKEYVISAVNLIGKSEFVFELEIRDYFRIMNASSAASFILHKYGKNQHSRGCRVNSTDIIEGTGNRDIRCFLEAEENDLHDVKIKFQSAAGAGVCEFISVTPFSFYRYPPLQTPATTEKSVVSGCAVAGATAGAVVVPADATTTTPTTESACLGNWTRLSTVTPGPNCDEGTYKVVTYSGSDNNNDGDCTDAGEILKSSPTTVSCNGKAGACVDGPARDLFDDTQINNGIRTVVYPTSDGLVTTHEFKTPLEKGNYTNRRAATSTIRNACTTGKVDAKDWTVLASTSDSTDHPFGGSSPYYLYNCLDAAKDIKARIRINVRDWDRTFKINYDIDLDEPASPAVDYMDAGWKVDTVFSSFYNNYGDWDDSFEASHCSDGVSATKAACLAATETWYARIPVCSNPLYTNKTDCLANAGTWDRDTGAEYPAGTCGTLPGDPEDMHKFPMLGL